MISFLICQTALRLTRATGWFFFYQYSSFKRISLAEVQGRHTSYILFSDRKDNFKLEKGPTDKAKEPNPGADLIRKIWDASN